MTEVRKLSFGSCAVLSVAAVLMYGGAASAATPLSVCVDTASPTEGVARQVATHAAKRAHRPLRVYEFNSDAGDEGYDVSNFRKLADDHCDLVMGFPLDTDAKTVRLPGLQMTKPYAHTGFVLVTPKAHAVDKLEQLPDHTVVGVTYLTTPNIYFKDYPKLQSDVGLNTQASVNELVAGKAQAAMLWRPAVVANLDHRGLRGDYHFANLNKPHSTYNIVALYAQGHAKDAAAFDKAVALMQKSGELAKILGQYAEPGPMTGAGVGNVKVVQSKFSGVVQSGDAFAAGSATASAAGTGKSATQGKPALYTAAQASAGHKTFEDNCSQCHGDHLQGFVGPALTGVHFAPPKANFHVKDIFAIVSKNMPATQPGSLTHQQYVEVMSFLLQQNGYPAGSTALTFEGATQSTVPFISKGAKGVQ
ncbi:MAG TPA: c-type cytochrome [Nevskiaceae bacterium]|nr:c-type cytochrome [Nevskiaceae bacterium]